MVLVRAVRIDDLDPLLTLVQSATRGLTSLQLDRNQLHDRIEQSVFAFSRTAESPRAEPYVIVMAEPENGQIVGTATIYAKTGGHEPFYAYRRVVADHHSDQLGVHLQRQRLELYRTHDGPTEIGSLFLRGKYRGQGRGRWLSLSRFTLIATRPHRFADSVIAEMRGRAEADGRVPFWDSVTGRFIPVPFAVADALSTMSKQFIEDMMPQFPIYLDLLPPDVCEGIGRVHAETEPAVALLNQQGFQHTDLVDIFDAGPVISCATKKIDAVRRTRIATVGKVIDEMTQARPSAIVASEKDGFTSVLGHVDLDADPSSINIDRMVAVQLGLEPGSRCAVTPLQQTTK